MRHWASGDPNHRPLRADCANWRDMSATRDTRLEKIGFRTASGQYGLLTTDQLKAMGLDKDAVEHRVSIGTLQRILPRVVGIAGTPDSYQRDVMAATLWIGEGGSASYSSAAVAWRLDRFEPRATVEVSSTRRNLRGPRSLPTGRKIIVHRVDERLKKAIVKIGELSVTSVPWTILDLAGQKHRRIGRVLDRAVRDGLTTLGEMWLLYEEEWIRGRRGVAVLRGLLMDRAEGLGASDSDLEELFWGIVRDYQLEYPTPQYQIQFSDGLGRVDFVYSDALLAVECDGWAWHGDFTAFQRDRQRDAELQAMGWVVLRLTWAQLKYKPGWVADQVRHHLESRPRLQAPSAHSGGIYPP